MNVLGIETSCDETAVAIVNDNKEILSHQIVSQIEEHQAYGGVVPEIAARNHLHHLELLVKRAVNESGVKLCELDAIAATCGPGLIGGVVVGTMVAKAMSATLDKPFIAINHLAAHALTPRLTNDLAFPYLLLLVSGGHCQLVIVKSPMDYQVLGTTLDDAVGECFDKCAKMMKLPYPGGPNVEKCALSGNGARFKLPIPLQGNKDDEMKFKFSFSGLKSSVKRHIEKLPDPLAQVDVNDLCASLQRAISLSLIDRLHHAISYCVTNKIGISAVVVSGGVAANKFLCSSLAEIAKNFSLPFVSPPIELCTDNGAMIAWAGIEKFRLGLVDDLSFKPRPRWSLDELNVKVVNDG